MRIASQTTSGGPHIAVSDTMTSGRQLRTIGCRSLTWSGTVPASHAPNARSAAIDGRPLAAPSSAMTTACQACSSLTRWNGKTVRSSR